MILEVQGADIMFIMVLLSFKDNKRLEPNQVLFLLTCLIYKWGATLLSRIARMLETPPIHTASMDTDVL